MRRAFLLLALGAAVAVGAPAAADHRDPLHGDRVEAWEYGMEVTGMVTGQEAPPALPSGAEGARRLPAEATLSVHNPVHEDPPQAGNRTAKARLTLRPASTLASPASPDPVTATFWVHWTKEPGFEEGGNRGHETRAWGLHLSGTVGGERLDLHGQWLAEDYFTVCTADTPPHDYCHHDAGGAVDLTGTWGAARVSLDGEALDRYCTVPDEDATVSHVYLHTRTVVDC